MGTVLPPNLAPAPWRQEHKTAVKAPLSPDFSAPGAGCVAGSRQQAGSSQLPTGCGPAEGRQHHAAGGEGGDTNGGRDGDGLPHLLAALHHVCPGGGHQQGHHHPAGSRLFALLLLQDSHRVQPHHLCLHEQAGEKATS